MRYIVNNDMPYFRVLYKAYIIEEVGVGGWKMFTWNRNAQIKTQIDTAPVRNAVDILYRDMEKTLKPVSQWCGDILLEEDNSLGEEQYRIEVETSQITIYAQDDLGWVYGLLLLSERFLGVKPFWFWMDQTFEQKESIEVVEQTIYSPKPVIRFRGWFFNDEVLMLKWKYNENGIDGWKMALEALLRCGGNMAIPGTDKMSRKNRQLAADMGADYFTTTLTISPLKNAAKLNEIGERLSGEYHIPWLVSDFKKKNGYKRSIELSAEYDLYRQDYCGCIYSKIERENQKKERT